MFVKNRLIFKRSNQNFGTLTSNNINAGTTTCATSYNANILMPNN